MLPGADRPSVEIAASQVFKDKVEALKIRRAEKSYWWFGLEGVNNETGLIYEVTVGPLTGDNFEFGGNDLEVHINREMQDKLMTEFGEEVITGEAISEPDSCSTTDSFVENLDYSDISSSEDEDPSYMPEAKRSKVSRNKGRKESSTRKGKEEKSKTVSKSISSGRGSKSKKKNASREVVEHYRSTVVSSEENARPGTSNVGKRDSKKKKVATVKPSSSVVMTVSEGGKVSCSGRMIDNARL